MLSLQVNATANFVHFARDLSSPARALLLTCKQTVLHGVQTSVVFVLLYLCISSCVVYILGKKLVYYNQSFAPVNSVATYFLTIHIYKNIFLCVGYLQISRTNNMDERTEVADLLGTWGLPELVPVFKGQVLLLHSFNYTIVVLGSEKKSKNVKMPFRLKMAS